MKKIDQLLFAKEKSGLIVSITVRMLVIFFTAMGHISNHHTKLEMYRVVIGCIILLIIESFALFFIFKGRFFKFSGYTNVLIDALILFFLPLTWYTSVGGYDAVPLTYALKSSVVLMTFVIIAINSLAIRAVYPALITLFFVIGWEILLYYVIADPRTQITTSFLETVLGPGVIVNYYRMPQLMIALVGGVFSYIVYTYRKSIHIAVNLEVSNTEMSRYFSPGVAERLVKDMENFSSLGGRNQLVAVLFCDIRNFTATSENMQPEQVVEMLREYHGIMVDIIFKHGGTLDKFIGDGMMVTFGTPDPGKQDSLNAVTAAIEMQRALIQLNAKRIQNGKDEIAQGIGIHYGPVIAGNIGTHNRMEYTVIGDTVNIASRIESSCKMLKESLLVSESVHKEIQKINNHTVNIEKLSNMVQMKGKSDAMQLYRVKY